MPLIDLSCPAGTFTPEARTALADELTTVVLRAERAPDTQFFHDITWVYAHELPEQLRQSAAAERESAGAAASIVGVG
jgi:phenylpyruvate tautomerase PptA (4-oxalocrotonate tautomerase family)